MSDRHTEHDALVGFLAGELGEADRARFERHLESCESCRDQLAELGPVAELVAESAGIEIEAPAGLEHSVMAAIEAEASAAAPPLALAPRSAPATRTWRRRGFARIAAAGLAAAAVVAAFVIGRSTEDQGPVGPGDPDAPLELRASLDGVGGTAEIEVRRLASGREIELVSDQLPVIPEDEFYELWFVAGSGSATRGADRISAGTFHPDAEGLTDVVMHAAVVPSLYPTLEITHESDDRPASSGDVVARLDAAGLIREP